MRLFKVLFLSFIIFFSSVSYAVEAPDRYTNVPNLPSIHNKIKNLPDVIKEFPAIYHEQFAFLFDDINLYIKSNHIPNSSEEDVAYMDGVAEILRKYAQSSLPFMSKVDMLFYNGGNGDLVLKIDVWCLPLTGIPYEVITLYWNISLIKKGDV